MSFRADAVEELRIKIGNYKRTRQTAVGPIRAWCDRLIRDAEDELQRLDADSLHAPHHELTATLVAADSTFPVA